MAAREIRRVLDHSELAQRYFDWAQQLRDRADQTTNPKIRRDRLALVEAYLHFAERELIAAARFKQLEAA